MDNEYLFWQAIYRSLLSIAAVIKKYKIEPCKDKIRVDVRL